MDTTFALKHPPETQVSELPLGLISDSVSTVGHVGNLSVALLSVDLSQADYAKVQACLADFDTDDEDTLAQRSDEHFATLIDVAARYVAPLHEIVLRFGKGHGDSLAVTDNWLGVVHADETTMSQLSTLGEGRHLLPHIDV